MRYLLVAILLAGCATVAPKMPPAEAGLPPEPIAVRELHRLVHARLPHLRLREVALGVSVDNLTQGVPPVGAGQIICTTGSTPVAAWESPSSCFGATQAWGITSLSLDSSGSTTATPAALGWSNWTTAEAIRISFGDLGTAIQVGFGDRLQMYSYNGLDIIAGRASLTPPAFVAGSAGADSINLTAGSTGKVITNSPLQIGTSGTSISASYATTVTTSGTPPTVAPQSCNTAYLTATLTGATTTATCQVGEQFAPGNLIPRCRVSAAGTVALVLCNPTAGNLAPPASSTYSIRVMNP